MKQTFENADDLDQDLIEYRLRIAETQPEKGEVDCYRMDVELAKRSIVEFYGKEKTK